MSLKEFYDDFMQELLAGAGEAQNFTESVFTERMCEMLEEQGVLPDFSMVGYRHVRRGIRLDAWAQDDESGSLALVVSVFEQTPEVQRLTQTNMEQSFARAISFFSQAATPTRVFAASLEESAPAFAVACEIQQKGAAYNRIQLVLVTNCELGPSVSPPASSAVGGIPCHYDVWDIGRLYRIEASGKAREDIVVDLTDHVAGGVPCLPAFLGATACTSYLMVLPGSTLASIYGMYGERLLEQNVRTFLQFRGKVNKGMRRTIETEPHMFFSYNNGISATAEAVTTTADGNRVLSMRNFQIVNGGQTTASIFTAGKKDSDRLRDVYVQVKLSIIPPEDVESVVPKISEYANTQNKVNAADFFSNHPFHLRIEEISRRLWAPSPTGTFKQTHWFYERARGQYVNAQASLTAGKRQFLAHNPRSQLITKTDLAKYVYTFDCKPHWVSLGAQKNFAKFASATSQDWDKNEKDVNDLFFKRTVAKALLFRELDREVLRQPWYTCGYKANIVTYALAKLAREVTDLGQRIDFDRIWERQAVSPVLLGLLVETARHVNTEIQKTDAGISNVTEWCKRELCWQRVEAAHFGVQYSGAPEIIGAEAAHEVEVEARKTQVIMNGITAQSYVFEKGGSYWQQMQSWLSDHFVAIGPLAEGVLSVACSIPHKIPSEKQSKILLKVEERALEEGFVPKP